MNVCLLVGKDAFHVFGEQVAVEFQMLWVILEPGVTITGWATVNFFQERGRDCDFSETLR